MSTQMFTLVFTKNDHNYHAPVFAGSAEEALQKAEDEWDSISHEYCDHESYDDVNVKEGW